MESKRKVNSKKDWISKISFNFLETKVYNWKVNYKKAIMKTRRLHFNFKNCKQNITNFKKCIEIHYASNHLKKMIMKLHTLNHYLKIKKLQPFTTKQDFKILKIESLWDELMMKLRLLHQWKVMVHRRN